jgi:CII-binding regulator of phage lambda lysogenization HflD
MSDEQDGHAKSRLDRLEGLMELLIDEHMKFSQEHKQLLTAQVVLNDQLEKLTDRVDKLAVAVQELREAQKHTDDPLNALIHIVDDWIRRTPPPQQ